MSRGTWVAQSVKQLTLDFRSGHDLTVHKIELCIGVWAESMKPDWDSLFPSLTASPHPTVLSLFSNKGINFKKWN